MFESTFQKCLKYWIRSGGDLGDLLQEVEDISVRTTRDAYRVCDTLDHAKAMLPTEREAREMVSTPLQVVTGLFQEVKTEAAYRVLSEKGLPILNEVVQESLYGGRFLSGQDILFVLKIMAAYRFRPVVRHLMAAIRKEMELDHYLWPVVFAHFAERDHPHALAVVEKLGRALPPGSPGIGLLHLANVLAERGQLSRHPFASEMGIERLGALLSEGDSLVLEDAVAATRALAFVEAARRSQLMALARHHPHFRLRLEALGIQVVEEIRGEPDGRLLGELVQHVKNPRYSRQAFRLLRQAGADRVIPDWVSDPEFQALADLSEYLENQGQFPGPPDALHVLETRELCWPPQMGESTCSLCQFTYGGGAAGQGIKGTALVNGHVTIYLEQALEHLAVNDLYAFFCAYEALPASQGEVNLTDCIARGHALLSRHRAEVLSAS